jgi:CRP-like cAMP-binding protein
MIAPHPNLLECLSAAHRAAVVADAVPVTYPPGTQLFRAADPAVGCWLIRAGHVALRTDVPGRGQVTIQTLGANDVLGLSWLIPPHRWHFTATTSTEVTALQLDTARLRARADADPAFGYRLVVAMFEILLSRLQSTRARLLDMYGSPREH